MLSRLGSSSPPKCCHGLLGIPRACHGLGIPPTGHATPSPCCHYPSGTLDAMALAMCPQGPCCLRPGACQCAHASMPRPWPWLRALALAVACTPRPWLLRARPSLGCCMPMPWLLSALGGLPWPWLLHAHALAACPCGDVACPCLGCLPVGGCLGLGCCMPMPWLPAYGGCLGLGCCTPWAGSGHPKGKPACTPRRIVPHSSKIGSFLFPFLCP